MMSKKKKYSSDAAKINDTAKNDRGVRMQPVGFRDADIEAMGQKGNFVDGPVNVIRLEGKINGTSKVMYFFMSSRHTIFTQTKCASLYSRDLKNYLVDGFVAINKSKQKLDVFAPNSTLDMIQFMERRVTSEQNMLSTYSRNFTKSYNVGLMILFARIYYNNNSPPFESIRIHGNEIVPLIIPYIYNSQLMSMFTEISEFGINNFFIFSQPMKDDALFALNDSSAALSALTEIYQNAVDGKIDVYASKNVETDQTNSSSDNATNQENDASKLAKLFYKLIHRVNNPEVKKLTNDLLAKAFEQEKVAQNLLKTLVADLDLIQKHFSKIRSGTEPMIPAGKFFETSYADSLKVLYDFNIHFEKISYCMRFIDTNIQIAFFLRRALDKSYITHTLNWSNYDFQLICIDALMKQFDFKITHAAFKTVSSIKDLNDKIKKTKNVEEVADLLLTENMIQCSNLDGFPKNFA